MFHILSGIQNGTAVQLQQYIDNRAGNLRCGLRSITYTVGWHNVCCAGETKTLRGNALTDKTIAVEPGLWSFDTLKERLEGIRLEVHKSTGLITLTVPANCQVQFTEGLLELLGLDDGQNGEWLDTGTYTGDRPVNFVSTKTLHVYLDQLNTAHNIMDGAPSTLLCVIGLACHSFGEIKTIDISKPQFKRLQDGTVHELKVTVRTDSGILLDNHNLCISVVLEIT